MARKDVHAFRPEFQAVPINNFGNNWNRIKKSAQELKRRAVIDSAALFHDRILHPVEHQNRWDGSDAQTLLKHVKIMQRAVFLSFMRREWTVLF